jgi:hypothetical protein
MDADTLRITLQFTEEGFTVATEPTKLEMDEIAKLLRDALFVLEQRVDTARYVH